MEISTEKYLKKNDKAPRHEKAASANLIIELLGNSKSYPYEYWLRKIGRASYSTVVGIIKEASSLDRKYSKGGYITNRLKLYGPTKHTKTTPTN